METMTPSAEQIEKAVDVIEAAAKKGGKEAITELVASGDLNSGNFQHGVLTQGDKIATAVKAAVQIILAEIAQNVGSRLKRLFPERILELSENDGRETLAESTDVFTAGIYGAAKRGPCSPTWKTPLSVYEMIKDGTYKQIFGGFGENLKRLCLTESQIVIFCRDPRNLKYLRSEGYGTFFLFEGEHGGFSVADVRVYDVGLNLRVYPLELDRMWHPRYQPRVVVPQL